jgi:hypothetical protein
LVDISELALKFRGEGEKPTLAAVARVANRASSLLRIKGSGREAGDQERRDDSDREEARSDKLISNKQTPTRRATANKAVAPRQGAYLTSRSVT